ncbi:MAG TPA: Gfo/Idh/MocA family oxidoreductase [Limnochordia bacterium]|nr:Gfo/Idh/MocA family oxidoreductase [Limnochordia bacterium]
MKRTRVAVVGCGSVSNSYIPQMLQCPELELVAVCDQAGERAAESAHRHGIGRHFSELDRLLDELDFDLLVNLTNMQFHAAISRKGLLAGRHVYSEKPLAGSVEEGQALIELAAQRRRRLWVAPNTITSPAFAALARALAAGAIGQPSAAQGFYGHGGPDWGSFYLKGGGCLMDLGVYNVTTLTGLLGPAKSVLAAAGIRRPERVVDGKPLRVEAEDNVALIMDHGDAVFSCVQTGFVFQAQRDEWTVQITGTGGAAALLGYDWAPEGVALCRAGEAWQTTAQDQGDWHWAQGVNHVARCLAEGVEPLLTAEHALHVLEVMQGALRSAETGRRVDLSVTFRSLTERLAARRAG